MYCKVKGVAKCGRERGGRVIRDVEREREGGGGAFLSFFWGGVGLGGRGGK